MHAHATNTFAVFQQRLLRGPSLGIQAFTVNQQHGLIAVASKVGKRAAATLHLDHMLAWGHGLVPKVSGTPLALHAEHTHTPPGTMQGLKPAVHIYSAHDFTQLGAIQLGFELGYSALAFSADGERLAVCGAEPENSITVLLWRTVCVCVCACVPALCVWCSYHMHVCGMLHRVCMRAHVQMHGVSMSMRSPCLYD